jgi:hypothetical protein
MKRSRQVAFVLLLFATSFVLPRISHAAEEDAVIKGFTDFLLDRANDNYIYIFQRKLESNALMKEYLPATLQVAKAGDLRSLLTDTKLWKRALKDDLEERKETLLDSALDKLEKLINGKLCPKGRASELEVPCREALEAVKNARAKKAVGDLKLSERVSLEVIAFTDSAQIMLAKNVLEGLKKDIEGARTARCEKGGPHTACVIQIVALFDAFARADYAFNCFVGGNWCWNRQRDPTIREEDEDFEDFRRFVLFFAQLADVVETKDSDKAKDSEKVKVLLKSVTVPPVSFGIKREPHRTRVLITSYLGGAWSTAIHRNDQAFIFAAPVGVEISQSRYSGNSLSFLLSPVDFGYPLTLKLNGSDVRVRASDIFVPSAYALWGWKNYPLAAGFGYARIKSIEDPGRREGRFLVLVAFDMPLFKLH